MVNVKTPRHPSGSFLFVGCDDPARCKIVSLISVGADDSVRPRVDVGIDPYILYAFLPCLPPLFRVK